MTTYNPTAVGLTSYTIPADGEDVTAASVNVALEALGDGIKAIMPSTTLFVTPDSVRWVTGLLAPSIGVTSLGTLVQATNTDFDNENAALGFLYWKTVNTMNNAEVAVIPLPLTTCNGWTISAAHIDAIGKTGHGALPGNMPRIALIRHGTGSNTSLCSTTWAVDSAADVAAYEVEHTITLSPDQNNVIDLTQYSYSLLVQNEGNTNATIGFQARRIFIGLTAP